MAEVNPNSKSEFWDNMASYYTTIELVNFQPGFTTSVLAGC